MTDAVCVPFLLYHPLFSPSSLFCIFAVPVADLLLKSCVLVAFCAKTFDLLFFFFLVPRDAAVSASAWVSSHPSSSFAVRDNTPRLCLPSTFFHTRHRTGVAYRSLDRFRCGRRIC